MVTSRDREMYRLTRYDYYHAGRLLYSVGNFHGAGIMLGYTIETTMKAGLMEVMPEQQWNDRILKSHDVRQIFAKCTSLGLFLEVGVSSEFLEHVNNNFQRYPSQIRKIVEQSKNSGVVLAVSADWLYFYDDLIVQLDHALLCRTQDPLISLVYHAIRTLETRQARDVLYKNSFAALQFDEYTQLVKKNMPEREDHKKVLIDNISKGASFYWDPYSSAPKPNVEIAQLCEIYSAKEFRLVRPRIVDGHVEILIP